MCTCLPVCTFKAESETVKHLLAGSVDHDKTLQHGIAGSLAYGQGGPPAAFQDSRHTKPILRFLCSTEGESRLWEARARFADLQLPHFSSYPDPNYSPTLHFSLIYSLVKKEAQLGQSLCPHSCLHPSSCT